MTPRFYLLKIRLLNIEPVIWRRFVVPHYITLDRLHDVIQIVMGWSDCHLFEFTIGKKKYTENPESKSEGYESGIYCLGDLIKKDGRTFQYIYDFGDMWYHEITLEDSHYFDPNLDVELVCLEGERSCPLEDSGGPGGYIQLLNILQNPKHKEYETCKVWSGGNFDSEHFDLKLVNSELNKYRRWSRNRNRDWMTDYLDEWMTN